MTTAFDVLQGYINAIDPGLHAAFNQLARITQHTHDALDQHTQLNITDIGNVMSSLGSLTKRLAVVESIISNFGDKFDDPQVGTKATAQRLANIEGTINTIAAQAKDHHDKLEYLNGADGRIEQKVYDFADQVAKHCSDKYEPILEQLANQNGALSLKLGESEKAYMALLARTTNLEAACEADSSPWRTQVDDQLKGIENKIKSLESCTVVASHDSIRGSMADAKRCQTIGRLGDAAVGFEQWIDSIESLAAEKYSFSSVALAWARSMGSEPLTSDVIEEWVEEQEIDGGSG